MEVSRGWWASDDARGREIIARRCHSIKMTRSYRSFIKSVRHGWVSSMKQNKTEFYLNMKLCHCIPWNTDAGGWGDMGRPRGMIITFLYYMFPDSEQHHHGTCTSCSEQVSNFKKDLLRCETCFPRSFTRHKSFFVSSSTKLATKTQSSCCTS